MLKASKNCGFRSKESLVWCPLWNNHKNMEWYGIVALYGMLFCGSVDYQNHKQYCLPWWSLCAADLLYSWQGFSAETYAIIRHVCGYYVFHGLLALWEHLNRESKNASFSESQGMFTRHSFQLNVQLFMRFGCLFTRQRLLGVWKCKLLKIGFVLNH